MATTPPTPVAPLNYQRLARLLDTAATDQQQLANTAGDPVTRYQSSVNAQLFTAARRCAQDHARSHPTTPPAAMTIPPSKGTLIQAAQS
jgi:hypothetical protein